ncbi:ketoacyl-ACP synthase III family protein [Nocardia arthritidis]|nr:ketoacyl-ACP synthase III family protein [Nocardia arthritidis]
MRYDDLYLASVASWLPPTMSAAEAIRLDHCEHRTPEATGVIAVTVASEADSPPEMAARAARTALARARCKPIDIDLVLHANANFQGHAMWSAAAYVQRSAVGNRCPAMEVRQSSNGGMAALALAAAWLGADPDRSAALVTGGDRWDMPAVDRWRSDPGTVYGDGAAALVLSRRGGFARLRSLALSSDSDLEGMHREGSAWGPASMDYRQPTDLGAHKRSFFAEVGLEYSADRADDGRQEALKTALAEGETELGEIDWFVLPHFGRRRLMSSYLRPLGIDIERTNWRSGRAIGHLGACDQFVGLEHFAQTGRLRAGTRGLVMGVGSGFSWSSAVIEILEEPRWPR